MIASYFLQQQNKSISDGAIERLPPSPRAVKIVIKPRQHVEYYLPLPNRELTNAPFVVRSLDDAILAAIELHDLPAPDDRKTPRLPGAGCPAPKETTNVVETVADMCPDYSSTTSQTNRSDSREVIRRFRKLSAEDQQAVIEFLEQL